MGAMPIDPNGSVPGEKNTVRVEAFSDGVIAIAITLLVLELRVPHVEDGALPGELLRQLGELLPNFFAFLTSFVTIGIMWLNHHNLFKVIQQADHWFIVINGFLLLGISFVSFPTALFAEYVGHPDGNIAAVLYGGTFTAIAICYNLLFRYAVARRLMHPIVSGDLSKTVLRGYNRALLLYAVSALVGLVSPIGTYLICTALAIFFILPTRVSAQLDGAEGV